MLCEHGNIAPCVECDVEPLKAENEALLARVAELERTGSTSTSCPFCFDQMRNSYILRKQAEAVEDFVQQMDSDGPWSYREDAMEYAQSLRQQADEIEKAGGKK